MQNKYYDKIDKIYKFIEENNILSLSDCDGSCPCGTFQTRGIIFSFHCWRTRINDCDCEYSGLHINQPCNFNYKKSDLLKLGELCLSQLKKVWENTDWKLVIEDKIEN